MRGLLRRKGSRSHFFFFLRKKKIILGGMILKGSARTCFYTRLHNSSSFLFKVKLKSNSFDQIKII